MMVELVDQFFEEFPAATGDGSDTIDTDEVITAIAGGRSNVRPERYDPAANHGKADA
jgi:hypothetical protein